MSRTKAHLGVLDKMEERGDERRSPPLFGLTLYARQTHGTASLALEKDSL
jgi:hypothetical protein